MRADRLVATLLILQRRSRVTAAEVAKELEISERTARRDLEALCTAGLPLYSQAGRGGGWSLLGGARTDLSGLTAAEARALFLVAGPSAAATPELSAALRKLVQALPEPFRDRAESAAASVVVDPGQWGERRRQRRPVHLAALQAATVDGEQVRLSYRSRDGAESVRVVHPLGLAVKGTVWYLVAGTTEGLRTFRVDRVEGVEPTGEPVVRPDGFDLEEVWRDVVDRVDDLRSPAEVWAVASPGIVDVLRWVFERRIEVGEPAPDGRVQVSVTGASVEVVAAQLAGFGDDLEITGPEEARATLGRIGRELVARYC